ncbi:MAG: glutamate decarboxylase [Candidatus Magnetoglobus multicellularis str. Araruama]|uniref:Glutamate decarboxylase n=1 Tax=Candidatus Magnetoglobus multicellularis str. Araruama TaxID=890399 RepID=A0A1V1PIC4_9BACT|nr:MAG: glutamate decarboxylase [Candidatus Magnetoglobus multicellularis str. Araruama]
MDTQTKQSTAALVANWEALQRIFIRPENNARQRLVKYMEQILFGLHDFLKEHVGITEDASLQELSDRFMDSTINIHPARRLTDVIKSIIYDLAPHAVNVASPYFIGHMTSAIPFFMVHLHTIVAALNQNVVKLETSKVVSIWERQLIAKIHRLFFQKKSTFYDFHIQNPASTLGAFVEDGTLANLSAMWVARNKAFPKNNDFSGIENEGVARALQYYDKSRAVILVSKMGHYSLRKAGGVLGIGNDNVIRIPINDHFQMDTEALKKQIDNLKTQNAAIIAVIAIAGTTETGTIDPIHDIADICQEHGIHFHVDAAWGGPTLLSEKYSELLSGIERADSVIVDGHKQFYMPMTCGMVFFNDPQAMDGIAYHSAYVNRPGSVDLGIRSIAGSRPATSLVLGNALEIMGKKGYALLIDHGIELAKEFAQEIQNRSLFSLISQPQLNILTYRVFPEPIKKKWIDATFEQKQALNETLNQINLRLQRLQRQAGNSFVSRTTIEKDGFKLVVLRSVLMNPMTSMEIICEILDEQETIYNNHLKIKH